MKKEVRIKVYNKYDGHCAYCGKPIKYEEMQVDHLVAKNRGGYARYDEKTGKSVVVHGEDALPNYMPACRACNFRKGTMRIEEFRAAIKQQAEAEKMLVQARAEREANELKSASLTPAILKKMWIEKWDGSVPTVVTGGNTSTFLDLSKIQK